MQPNYMQYAEMINQAGDRTRGLSSLGNTIDQVQAQKLQQQQLERQRMMDARANKLSDLQYNAAELNYDQDRAKSLSEIDQYGTGDRPDFQTQLADAQSFKAQEADIYAKQKQMAELAEKKQKTAMEKGLYAINVMKGVAGALKDGTIKDAAQADQIYDAALKEAQIDPGEYHKGYVFQLAQEVPKHIPEGAAVPDGKGGYTIPAPRKEKPIIINTGGRGGPTGKPPSGYRYTAEGNLEAIPGGPAAQKQADREILLGNGKAAIDLSMATIDKLINHPGRSLATGKSRMLQAQRIPGTDAYGFDKELESFDAQLFLSNIQQMKGMGALSNAEGAKVSAAAGAIKPGMKDEAFIANMGVIKAALQLAKDRIDSGKLISPSGSPQGNNKPASKRPDPLGIL